MIKILLTPILTMFLMMVTLAQDYEQIIAKKVMQSDTFYHNYIVEDPYRWMENINTNELKAWSDSESKMTTRFLSKCSNKTNAFNDIDKFSYTEFHCPTRQGNYYFHYAYYNNVANPALFYQPTLNTESQLLVDPNFISPKDEIMLKGHSVSKDSKLLAYEFSRNGSDWAEVKIVSLQNGIHKKDHLTGLKFSNLAWKGDGFFYSSYPTGNQFEPTIGQKVFYHKIGTEQVEDKVVFERKNNPSATFEFTTSADEQYFILKEKDEKKGKVSIFYIDYQSDQQQIRPLVTNLKEDLDVLDSHDGKFIAITIHDANNGNIVSIDPANPYKWQVIAAEYSKALLLKAIPFSDRIVAVYQANYHPIITVMNYAGDILNTQELPVSTSVKGLSGNSTDEEVLFYITSYTLPPVVYSFNLKTFSKKLTHSTTVNFGFENIVYEEVEYPGKDSVNIPMVLIYEKGLKTDGTNPVILTAYGGFGVIASPSFDPGLVYFIKKGGMVAYANIRGGGDKGSAWAHAGRGEYKQNSFNDFISAAEYLIKNKYTNSEKLAITGSSNGGLVVAAAAIQRPDLFKAVVPVVAPLDMIRFEKFTVGARHNVEYGTVNDSAGFTRLYAYSPYQNIREDVNYPTILVITSENDDRVPPFHSYKFVARMQNRSAQKNPIYLKIEKDAGHHGASTLYSGIKEMADIYGFIMYELNGN